LEKNNHKLKHLKYTAIDLFSGCGGVTTGLKKAGFKVLSAIDINKKAVKVYKLNHPDVKVVNDDIKKIDLSIFTGNLNIDKGSLDLLVACPPCQGFSRLRTKNKEKPVNDERNDLVLEIIRFVKMLYPKFVLIENVPGLLKDWRIEEVKRKLGNMGYLYSCNIIDAADYGIPQRRKRMILMASRLGDIVQPDIKYKRKTVRDAIGKIKPPKKSKNKLHCILSEHNEKVYKRIKSIPKNGGGRNNLNPEYQLSCHNRGGFNGFKDVYGRMSWDRVSPTLTRFCINPSKGRFIHPEQDRAISLYEAMILQTFPKSYKFPIEIGRGHIASMIGEALPPLLVQRQASIIIKHIIKNNG